MIRLSHIKFRTKWQLFLDKVLLYAVISCVPLCWIGIPACLLVQSRPVAVETRVIHEPAPVPEEKQPDTAAWNLYKEKGDTPEGLRALLKAAESGMPEAAALMAKFYEEGKYFAKNDKLAMHFFRIGAEVGGRDAMGALGRALLKRGEYAEAWAALSAAAERGDAMAAVDCGRMSAAGLYVPKDKALAAKYWEQAATLGHPGVIAELARIHREGDGVPKNPERAAEFLLRGAQGGDMDAMLAYAAYCIEKKNSGEAVFWYQRAAEKKSARAAESLAQIFEAGLGVPKDLNIAEEWHRKAMSYGSPEAAYALGKLLRRSQGRDREAYAVFMAAAKGGHARALFHVGDMREHGIGTEKDLSGAVDAYRKSAAGGCRDAENRLARMGRDGVKIPAASSSEKKTKTAGVSHENSTVAENSRRK